MAFFALVGYQLSTASTERTDGMQATGAVPPGGAPMANARDTKGEALSARVQQNPDDIEGLVELGIHLFRRQGLAEGRSLFIRALFLDPFHPKARVGGAVIKAIDGDLPGALAALERLSSRYPEAYDGYMFAGMLAVETNELARAIQNFETYLAVAPADEQPPMIRMAIQQLRQQLVGPPSP